MHALKAAFNVITAAAAELSDLEDLDEPAARMALARKLREEADRLERRAKALRDAAMGIGVSAEIEIDPTNQVVITEEED